MCVLVLFKEVGEREEEKECNNVSVNRVDKLAYAHV